MTIRREISSWDGKSAEAIRQIYDRHAASSSFLNEILGLLPKESLQNGATWLLKRHVETAGCPDTAAVRSIYESLPSLRHWESKLHVLQIIPCMPIPAGSRQAVEKFVRQCLGSDMKFVRAWAYGGFYELAVQYPQYREEAERLIEAALEDEPASVRARVRKVSARGFD